MLNINEIESKLKSQIGDKLYNHCFNTMNTAEELAKHYGINEEKAAIAGLLHDCGKLLGQKVSSLEHASVGAKLAKDEYGIVDKEILDAILYHTTGRENMSMLEKIIYIADKIEPNRHYDYVVELRKIVYNDIDLSIIKSLENTMSYLHTQNIDIDEQTLITLDYLKKQKKLV